MIFHYGESWTKIDRMMDLCELYLETTLQVLLQVLCFQIYPTRALSKTQMASLMKSGVMATMGLTKIFLPAKLWNDQQRSTIRKGRNVLWAGCLLSLFAGNHFCYILPIVIALFTRQGILKEVVGINQGFTIGGFAFILIYSMISFIFMYKNSFPKSRQAQLKCVLLSIYFLLWCAFESALHFQDWKSLSRNERLEHALISLNWLWQSIFLFYASFIVTKLHDIFNLEVIETKQNCFLRHLPFATIFLVVFMDLFQATFLHF